MSFARYPEYRDSEVEWVPRLPGHWAIQPLLAIANQREEPNAGLKEPNLLSLSYGRIVPKDMNSNDGLLPETFETYQIVHPGDSVLRLTDLQNDKRSLRTALVKEKGIITSAYLAITPKTVEPSFFAYLLRAYDLTKVFYSMGGGLRQSMKFDDLKRMPVIVPAPSEQSAIAAFLDREAARIDLLVAEQERLIELLREKRQAVLSRAITKGLNPTAPMCESGVDWYGKVPSHWALTSCKRLVRILSGYAFPSTGFSESEAATRLLRGINVGVGTIRWDDVVCWERREGDGLDEYALQAGDLVLGMDRPLIREGMRVAQLTAEDVPCLLLQRVVALRTDERLDVRYLSVLLSSAYFIAHFEPETTGVSVPHISPEQIGDFLIPLPSLGEQQAIVDHIACESRRIDQLVAQSQEAIALLQERRSALISAAVTGQIDVRGLVEPAAT